MKKLITSLVLFIASIVVFYIAAPRDPAPEKEHALHSAPDGQITSASKMGTKDSLRLILAK